MVAEVPCRDQRWLRKQCVSLVITTLIVQQLIKAVLINMHSMFALNHTSEACLFKPETTWSSSCWFHQVQFLETLPLLFLYLHHPFSCLLPGSCAQRQSRGGRGAAVRAQDPATADKSSGLTSQDLACRCFQSVCAYCTNLQLQVQQNQSSVRLASRCTEPDHWHPGESFRASNIRFFSYKGCS